MSSQSPEQQASASIVYGDLPAADSAYFSAALNGHLIISGHGYYLGRSFHNTSGASASLAYVRDGTDINGEIIDIVRTNSNIEETVPIPWPGVYFQNGLYVSEVAGVVEGVLWFVAL